MTGPTRFQIRSGALAGGTEQGFWTPGAPNAAPDPQIPYLPLETPPGPVTLTQFGVAAVAGVIGISGDINVAAAPQTFRLLAPVRGPRISGVASVSGDLSTGISVLASALTAQKESEGTANYVATLGIGTAGVTLLAWDAGYTTTLATPISANNGNTFTSQFSQAYGNGFEVYSLRGWRCYSSSGGSNHAATGTKNSSTSGEATIALLALSGGQIGSRSSVVQRNNAGAGATLTSGTVTMTAAGLLVAVCSGDGTISDIAPTQTWPEGWTVLQSVAYNRAQAPNGHVPLYVAVKSVSSPGDYSVGIQMTINEGATIALYGVQP